jgi:hypothetical protein
MTFLKTAAVAAILLSGAAFAADAETAASIVRACCDIVAACCGQGNDCCP